MRIPVILFSLIFCPSVFGQEISPEIFLPVRDTFRAEEKVETIEPISDDLFATGFSVKIKDRVEDDAHLIGFQIEIEDGIGGNLYASGGMVEIDASVDGDITSTGFSIDVGRNVEIGGNARLAGRSINLDGTIRGSASIAADTLTLAGVVMGDINFFGRTIHFADNAKINGTLSYHTPSELEIPPTVISSDLTSWKPWNSSGTEGVFGEKLAEHSPSIWSVVTFFLAALAATILLAMVFLGLMPQRVEQLRIIADSGYKRTIIYGFFTLAALFGLVPAAASTIVGAPLVPIIIMLIGVMWLLGYFLGVYTISYRLFDHYFPIIDSNVGKLIALLAGLLLFAVLNVVPFLGWLLNLFALFIGLGAISRLTIGDELNEDLSNTDQGSLVTA